MEIHQQNHLMVIMMQILLRFLIKLQPSNMSKPPLQLDHACYGPSGLSLTPRQQENLLFMQPNMELFSILLLYYMNSSSSEFMTHQDGSKFSKSSSLEFSLECTMSLLQ